MITFQDRVWNWIIETDATEWDFGNSKERDEVMEAVKAYIDKHGNNRICMSSQNPYKVFLSTWEEMHNFVRKPNYYATKNGVLTKID